MGHKFGTPEWAATLRDTINGSSEYRNAAAAWGVGFDGSLLFEFQPDADLERALGLRLELSGGACQAAEFVGEGAKPAAFSLSGPFGVWRAILERKMLAATAILTGKLRVGGDKMALLKHTAAHRALVHCVASVDTSWTNS
jgi:putative sterol carrier protein